MLDEIINYVRSLQLQVEVSIGRRLKRVGEGRRGGGREGGWGREGGRVGWGQGKGGVVIWM